MDSMALNFNYSIISVGASLKCYAFTQHSIYLALKILAIQSSFHNSTRKNVILSLFLNIIGGTGQSQQQNYSVVLCNIQILLSIIVFRQYLDIEQYLNILKYCAIIRISNFLVNKYILILFLFILKRLILVLSRFSFLITSLITFPSPPLYTLFLSFLLSTCCAYFHSTSTSICDSLHSFSNSVYS